MNLDEIFKQMDAEREQENWSPVSGYPVYDEYQDTEIVEVIDRDIGDMSEQISIAGESDSQYIVYEMPRYYDGIDVTQKNLQIHYENDFGGSENVPVNVQYTSSRVRLGWIVPKAAVQRSGKVKMCIYALGTSPEGNEYILKTGTKVYEVKDGLFPGSGIEVDNDWYLTFYNEMTELVSQAQESANKAQQAAETAVQHSYTISVEGKTLKFISNKGGQ